MGIMVDVFVYLFISSQIVAIHRNISAGGMGREQVFLARTSEGPDAGSPWDPLVKLN